MSLDIISKSIIKGKTALALTDKWLYIGKDSISNIHSHLPSDAQAVLWSSVCLSISASEMEALPRGLAIALKAQDTETENPLKATPYIANTHPSVMFYAFFPLVLLMSNYWSYKTLYFTCRVNIPCHMLWTASFTNADKSMLTNFSQFLCDQSTENGLQPRIRDKQTFNLIFSLTSHIPTKITAPERTVKHLPSCGHKCSQETRQDLLV